MSGSVPQRLVDGPEGLRVGISLPDRAPQDLYRDWTEPDRLRAWWPPEAELDLREGGTYTFSWPQQGWKLRGRFLRVIPGSLLEFTWRWDHEPAEESRVIVSFNSDALTGTQLYVEQGPYPRTARGDELRKEHMDGWVHFLSRLAVAETSR